ncbi:f-actin-capping protein subunit [Cystoisospora suis]|uniref:F-actin-capping protein subunit n=1 Tax=Cystoisospora suis TaxID=483139 RepID=A0A2C6LAF2_9APIC|nr:f-actin-capping protein subunit [Cystoisospora suis]
MLTRTSELSQKVVDLRSSPDTPPHIGVIGPMIEQMEEGMRTSIERMYLAKAYAIVDGMLRSDRNTTGVETAAVFYELNSSLSVLVGAGVPAAAAGRPAVGRAAILTSGAQDLPSRIRSMVKEKEGSLREKLQKNDSV